MHRLNYMFNHETDDSEKYLYDDGYADETPLDGNDDSDSSASDDSDGSNDSLSKKDEVNTCQLYYRDTLNHDIYTREEEIEIFHRMKAATTKEERNRIRNEIVTHNAKLVNHIVKKSYLKNKSAALDRFDMTQEGMVGLLKAVEMFDVDKGFRFSTYAKYWIIKSLQTAIANQNYGVSTAVIDSIKKMTAVENEFFDKYGREPTQRELAEIMNVSLEKIQLWKDVSRPRLSFEYGYQSEKENRNGDSVTSFKEMIADNTSNFEDDLVEKLSPNEATELLNLIPNPNKRKAIIMRFGLDGNGTKTINEIYQQCNIKKNEIGTICNRFIKLAKFYHRYKRLPPQNTKKTSEQEEN